VGYEGLTIDDLRLTIDDLRLTIYDVQRCALATPFRGLWGAPD
jgi:hypothetical protein